MRPVSVFVLILDGFVKSQNLAQRRKARKVNLLILKDIFLAFSASLRENILFTGPSSLNLPETDTKLATAGRFENNVVRAKGVSFCRLAEKDLYGPVLPRLD